MSTQMSLAAPAALSAVPNSGFETEGNWTFSANEGAQTSGAFVAGGRGGDKAYRVTQTSRKGYSMLESDFISVQPETEYEASAWVRVPRKSWSSVYLMASQYTADSPEMRFPNEFGAVRPIISTGDAWQRVHVYFKTRAGNTRVKLHALMTGAPIEILWDDFAVQVSGGGEYKPRFEPPTPEPLMSQEEAQKIVEKRTAPRAKMKMVNGRARLFINGKMAPPAFYVSPFWNPSDAQIADFQKAGAQVFYVPLMLGYGFYGKFGVWKGKDQYDFSQVDERLWRVLRANPNAYVMFYMPTDPYPRWAEENPDSIVVDQDGKRAVVDMHIKDWGRAPNYTESAGPNERYGHSYVSQKLRVDTSEALRKLAQHINSSVAGKAVLGFHVCGGNDGQFFEWADFSAGHLSDYSAATRDSYRDWLRRRYKTDAALQKAWNKPTATLANATVPEASRRRATGMFLSGLTDNDIADYNRFVSEGIVESIQTYARVLKTARPGTLISTYYSGPSAGVFSHLATGKLLSTQDVDITTSVASYDEVRWPGGTGKAHSAWSSLLLHNKIGLVEQDYRSWKAGYTTRALDYSVGRFETADDHNAVVRRESGMTLAVGNGAWWYDMSGGWFSDPTIMRAVKQTFDAHQRDLSTQGAPRADVAVFINERSLDYLTYGLGAQFRYNAIQQQVLSLNGSGVPYHTYLQSDLPNLKQNYKLYLFLNPQHISAAEKAAMNKLKRGGRTLAFAHIPMLANGDPKSASTRASQITGITFQDGGERPLSLSSMQSGAAFDAGEIISPVKLPAASLIVTDKNAKPLATYDDGKIGAAARDFGTWKSVFFGGTTMSETFINGLAKYSGAWVAAPAGDAVYANQNFISYHARYGGNKVIALPQRSNVIDARDRRVLARRVTSFSLPMKYGETRWFYLNPAK